MRREVDPTTSREEAALIFGAIALTATLLAGAWLSLHTAASLHGDPAPPNNPIDLILDLARGEVTWTGTATTVAIGYVVALIAVLAVPLWLVTRARRRRQRPDRASRHLARGTEVRHLNAGGATAKATRLGISDPSSPGVPIGRRVPGGTRLFASWEDMVVIVAGPRTMKSTAMAIPALMAAPGAALATSNKRDVVDTTRRVRGQLGQTWVFDPQQVANEPVGAWWWNPLTYIAPYDPTTRTAAIDPHTGAVAADEARAEKLAVQLCTAAAPAGARRDSYFDPEAENLVGLLLLAAACGQLPITQVYSWLTAPGDLTPVRLLAEHYFTLQEESLHALVNLPDKQREGVYGTARSRLGWLRNRAMVKWVTPPAHHAQNPVGGHHLAQFHPTDFAHSTDTLYPLSREGDGSAGPLVAALTMAVVDALEDAATASPGGRLPVPFLGVLDEAANICRFRNLDSYYSHFGSRGIIMMTILQNWAQGEEVWGPKGMEKLWSAANVKIYGGGVDDDRFLRRLSDLIGTYHHLTRSESSGGKGGRQRSRSTQERTIMTVAELRELPTADRRGKGGRAVVFASGTPAILIEPQPWWADKDAQRITTANTDDQVVRQADV